MPRESEKVPLRVHCVLRVIVLIYDFNAEYAGDAEEQMKNVFSSEAPEPT
jgi:hypothetical protein